MRSLAALCVVAVLAVTGCGDSSSPKTSNQTNPASSNASALSNAGTSSEGPVDACSLFTDDEMSTALGGKVAHGGTGTSCEWHIDTTDPFAHKQVSLSVGAFGTAAGNKVVGSFDYGPATPVDGVGDGARISSGGILVLEFPANHRLCSMQYVDVKKPENQQVALDVLVPLAKQVRKELP